MSIPTIPPVVQFAIIGLLCILSIWLYETCSQTTVALTSVAWVDNNCHQSLLESDGLICESNSAWNERKYIYHAQDKENMMKRKDPIYFVSNWEPNFHCSFARRVGEMGDGGKWVCDVYRLKSRKDCLIYSVGSRGEFSFEIDLKKFMPHCEIHTFDKSLYTCPKNICKFHQIILGNGMEPNGSKDWMTVIRGLNHTKRSIEILKIDIEGSEFGFFPLVFNSSKSLFPRQILVEIHPTNITRIHRLFELLRRNNYVIFNKENNLYAGPFFFEYGFLKLNPRFFNKPPDKKMNK